jgi:hypothetical protein
MLILAFSCSRWHYKMFKSCYPMLFVFRSHPLRALLLVDAPLDIMWTRFRSCVGSRACDWLLTHFTTLAFRLSLAQFFTTLCSCIGLPHPTVAIFYSVNVVYHWWLSTHLLWCFYENERIIAHNTFWDIVVTIVLEIGTHVQREVSHLFPLPHLTTIRYFYHQRWLPNFDGCCHC